MIRDELIYNNDFENNDMSDIDGGGITYFNDTNVIGNFNNDGFTLHLSELEITIIFLFHLIFIYTEAGTGTLMDLKIMTNLINGF